MKILNLHCGIGGNRKKWGNEHEITAVDLDESVALIYSEFYPEDEIIIGDADEYLLANYKAYDFIWSSNPCPKNSRARYWSAKNNDLISDEYPDLTLYKYFLFLDNWYDGLFVIENVIPYYKPLIPPTKKIGRHYFWANFPIGNNFTQEADIKNGNIKEWQELHGIDISGYKLNQRRDKILRNCVHFDTGLYILNCALGIMTKENPEQLEIFQ